MVAVHLVTYRHLVEIYNRAFKCEVQEEGVEWLDMSNHFPEHQLQLWARDGVHLSDEMGTPFYIIMFVLSHGTGYSRVHLAKTSYRPTTTFRRDLQ